MLDRDEAGALIAEIDSSSLAVIRRVLVFCQQSGKNLFTEISFTLPLFRAKLRRRSTERLHYTAVTGDTAYHCINDTGRPCARVYALTAAHTASNVASSSATKSSK